MTAYSKAQKRAQKRGRRPLPAIDREPNGRASRRHNSIRDASLETQKDIMDAAVSTRIRHFNLSDFRAKDGRMVTAEEQAKDPRNGYVLGRMLMDHALTEAQHDIGIRYAKDMARYYGLTGVAFPSARAQDLFAARGSSGEDSDSKGDAARKARERVKKLEAILLGVQDISTGRRVEHTVKSVCLLDIAESRGWPPHMTSWLKLGLNALGKYYGAC